MIAKAEKDRNTLRGERQIRVAPRGQGVNPASNATSELITTDEISRHVANRKEFPWSN
jgi:hypothetical protein